MHSPKDMSASHLSDLSQRLRDQVLRMITTAQSGHPGGSLSALDIILALYAGKLRFDPKNPQWEDRDRFVLSKGHGVPALYAVMAQFGYFNAELLPTLRQVDSPLQGHPANTLLPGIEAPTGSLGQGISVAQGMAMAAKLRHEQGLSEDVARVYVLAGDGELQEGQVWEAFMSAAHYQVANLTIFVDRNNGQIDGTVDQVMGLEPLDAKCESFGLHVQKINGHNFDEIFEACTNAEQERSKPSIIIADTLKGKGVSFMESDVVGWHGKAPTEAEYNQSKTELTKGL